MAPVPSLGLSQENPGRPRIRTFSVYCREQFGQPVGKIPLDLGIPCPNRLHGGCLFCSPASFTPFSLRAEDSIPEQIFRGKRYLLRGRFCRYFAYFQQETPTVLSTDRLVPLLEQVLEEPDCVGLIISTRPDAIAEDLPATLAQLSIKKDKECLIELGLQSIHTKSLQFLNRNHSYADVVDAVERIQAAGKVHVGVHILFGIPGETVSDMVATLDAACALGVQTLKLHHLQVVRGAALANMYARGHVRVFSREEYQELLLLMLARIPSTVVLHRLWATAHPHVLVAPHWGLHTGELSRALLDMMEARGVYQGMLAKQGVKEGKAVCAP